MSELMREIAKRLISLDLNGTLNLAKEALEEGYSAHKILSEGISKGMEGVGNLFEKKEYFLADLVTASYIVEKAIGQLQERLRSEVEKERHRGKVIFGTVEGDLHDIGKNIAIAILRASGYEVIDLGIDVSPENFVKAVKEHRPKIVGMSALLLTTLPGMGEVVEALKKAGLRDGLFIMIGGRPTSKALVDRIGADVYCPTAMDGLKEANAFMETGKQGGVG